MNVKNLAEKFEKNELTFLKDEDTFKFSCNMCGNCCFDRQDILISPYDAYRISKELKMPTADFINKYCYIQLGGQSAFPIVGLKFKKLNFNGSEASVCPFLMPSLLNRENLICSIHKSKPSACAIYPLGRAVKGSLDEILNDAKVEYFDQKVVCCDLPQETHTLKKWKEDFNLVETEKFFLRYSKFLTKCMDILDFSKFALHEIITDKTKQMLYNAIINLLYIDIEKAEDIEKDLEDRYNGCIDAVTEMVRLMNSVGIRGITRKKK